MAEPLSPAYVTLGAYRGPHMARYAAEWTDRIEANAADLLARVNRLIGMAEVYSKWRYHGVTSGWRPRGHNEALRRKGVAAAINSKHIDCNAIDLRDDEGLLDEWLLIDSEIHRDDSRGVLDLCGLWLEHPAATKGWCHLQRVAPLSKRRVFYP